MTLPIEDRLALRELVDVYASAVDRRDEAAFRSLWLPDARLTTHAGDGPPEGDHRGVDEIARVITILRRRYVLTFHLVGNHVCRLDDTPGDGGGADTAADTATGEAACVGHHLTPTGDGRYDDHVMGIRYLDRYARDATGRWRFARREVRRQWTRHDTVDGFPTPGAT
ncbi:MAG TPA: nuclear transport factor 2 family protein [Acidimicrobiales bacterium]